MRRWLVVSLIAVLAMPSVALAARGDRKKSAAAESESEEQSKLSAGTLSGLALRGIGPALMSGRIADIAVHPNDASVWYVAVGSGNVWKTANSGTTWETIFDDQGSYSIGCVTVDPNQPETIWVGTGENVGGRHVGYGDGIYKSLDGGQSWTNMGLAESEHIGNIVVDPRDSSVVYVAVQGPLWSAGGDRGLYKTTDGGESWEKILGGGEFTGVNEVHLHPHNPDILLAATHQRVRTVAALINGGPESGIHKSTDGGATWREVRSGLPREDMGKIGLAYLAPDSSGRGLRDGRAGAPRGRVLSLGGRRRDLGEAQRLPLGRHRPPLLPGDLRQPASSSTRVYQMDARTARHRGWRPELPAGQRAVQAR